ncbi:glycosyltransferase [Aeromonas sp. S41-2]|uniref:glycosyltransferase n=1 Tax=Aeromonas sp. S41-2 TaxID=2990502 RepID=UPI0022E572C5|nr:glycosyltransferase [Aeromonas sp. S41-2]
MKEKLKDKKIAIGIIVYNPTVNLSKRIEIALRLGFDLYVLDNTPQRSTLRDNHQNQDGFHYLTLGQNIGLGIGMSAICAQAYYDGYSHLLFFDQDTVFSADTLNFIVNFYEKNKKELGKFSVINFNSKEENIIDDDVVLYSFRETNLVINSGSLINLDALRSIGWYDISYFVDGVDYKFCLDSVINKYKIGVCGFTPGFDHVAEQDDVVYKLFGRKFLARRYNPNRVRDTLDSLSRLLFSSIVNRKWKYSYIFIRQLAIYCMVQVYVRLVSPAK